MKLLFKGIAIAMAAILTLATPAELEARSYNVVPEPAYTDIEQEGNYIVTAKTRIVVQDDVWNPAELFAKDMQAYFGTKRPMHTGKYGKGIINNAKTKIVLNLEDEEAQRAQDILHLSETETMAITHFERGNGLISTNNNNITVEFKASELEKELITTDRRELKEIVDRARQNVNYNTPIDAL